MMALQIVPETYFTANEQLLLFGGACLLGIPAGLAFDAGRILRRTLPHRAAVVAIEDVLFLLYVSLLLLGYSYAFARGEFRVYYAMGCLLGWALYACTIGRLVVGVLAGLLRVPCWICKKICLRFVGNSKKTEKPQKNDKNPLQERGEMVYNNRMKFSSPPEREKPSAGKPSAEPERGA